MTCECPLAYQSLNGPKLPEGKTPCHIKKAGCVYLVLRDNPRKGPTSAKGGKDSLAIRYSEIK